MNNVRRTAIVASLAEQLRRRRSWCGETHVQKATYFLQELLRVPLGFRFVLYKHGPYSFDLRDHLAGMRADGYLDIAVQPYPYGPTLLGTSRAQHLVERSTAASRYRDAIGFVAEHLAEKRVSELERLATALCLRKQLGSDSPPSDQAARLCALKPHVRYSDALEAVTRVESLAADGEPLMKSHRVA